MALLPPICPRGPRGTAAGSGALSAGTGCLSAALWTLNIQLVQTHHTHTRMTPNLPEFTQLSPNNFGLMSHRRDHVSVTHLTNKNTLFHSGSLGFILSSANKSTSRQFLASHWLNIKALYPIKVQIETATRYFKCKSIPTLNKL